MPNWIAPFVFAFALPYATLVADEPLRRLKVGDLVHIDLIGDAAQRYAKINRLPSDKMASPIPILSMFAIVQRMDDESTVYIERQLETVVNANKYLCTLKGTFPGRLRHDGQSGTLGKGSCLGC